MQGANGATDADERRDALAERTGTVMRQQTFRCYEQMGTTEGGKR
jgi:hypothetical protein